MVQRAHAITVEAKVDVEENRDASTKLFEAADKMGELAGELLLGGIYLDERFMAKVKADWDELHERWGEVEGG